MVRAHHLSAQEVKFERAKAERANFIVSEVVSDHHLMGQALNGIEACERGICLLWPEFLQWERSQRGEGFARDHSHDLGARIEPRLTPRVRDLVTRLSDEDRAVFERSLAALCANPHIDNVARFSAPYPPVVLSLYLDGSFLIIYRLTGGSVVDVLNVSVAPEVPAIEHWDEWQAG